MVSPLLGPPLHDDHRQTIDLVRPFLDAGVEFLPEFFHLGLLQLVAALRVPVVQKGQIAENGAGAFGRTE